MPLPAGFVPDDQPQPQGGLPRGFVADKPREKPKAEGPPSMVGSFFRSMLEGAKETGLGAAQFGVDLLTPGYLPGRRAAIQGLGNMAAQSRQAYQGSPDVRTNPMT